MIVRHLNAGLATVNFDHVAARVAALFTGIFIVPTVVVAWWALSDWRLAWLLLFTIPAVFGLTYYLSTEKGDRQYRRLLARRRTTKRRSVRRIAFVTMGLVFGTYALSHSWAAGLFAAAAFAGTR